MGRAALPPVPADVDDRHVISTTAGIRVEGADGVARITIDHPPVNVLDTATLGALAGAIEDASSEATLRAIVIRGAGRAFSAGVDIGEHMGDALAPLLASFQRAAAAIVSTDVPVIAVAHGAVLGGACELVTLADLAIVADDAKLGVPEIRLGVVPPVAAAMFPRLVGAQRAAALLFTGDTISGEEAARWGLVWRSVPRDRLEPETEALLERLRSLSSVALRLAKRTMRETADLPIERAIAVASAISAETIPAMHDAQEGLRAFLEKRSPVWAHR